MGCLVTKTQHMEDLKDQEKGLRTEMLMMEQTIGQLRSKSMAMKTNELRLQLELLELKNKVVELRLFNSDIVSWSSGIGQQNADLRSQLYHLKKWQGKKSVLKERYILL